MQFKNIAREIQVSGRLLFWRTFYLVIRSKGTKSTLSTLKTESRYRYARGPTHLPQHSVIFMKRGNTKGAGVTLCLGVKPGH